MLISVLRAVNDFILPAGFSEKDITGGYPARLVRRTYRRSGPAPASLRVCATGGVPFLSCFFAGFQLIFHFNLLLGYHVANLVRQLGQRSLNIVQEAGAMMIFLLEGLGLAFVPPFRFRRVLQEIYQIGVKSTLIVMLTAAFTGMVMALQGYYTLRQYGSEGALGGAVALGLIREMGPVLTGIMVSARAGSAVTAEIGIMRITEQLDALDTMAVNPIQYVVMPKLLAGVIAVPLLTAIFDVVGILGGYLVGVVLLGVGSGAYFASMKQSVVALDINGGIVKSLVFGLTIILVACYKGYHTEHGAEGVSKATNQTVVLSAVLVLAWDYVLTSFFM
jgi:phospholipid/cholesterol/gamma-HCH transport system permease protein